MMLERRSDGRLYFGDVEVRPGSRVEVATTAGPLVGVLVVVDGQPSIAIPIQVREEKPTDEKN